MNPNLHSKWLCCAVVASIWCLAGNSALAQEDPERNDAVADMHVERGSRVLDAKDTLDTLDTRGATGSLDSFLQLPRGFVTTEPRSVAGANEREWRRRFQVAVLEISEAQRSLDATKRELDGVALNGGASQWSIAAPGGGGDTGNSTSPLSFKLRQQLRNDRERIESTERAMRALRIEADLAGVPVNWRQPDLDPERTSQN